MNKILENLPSTNFRVFVTMMLVTVVILRYALQGIAVGAFHFDAFSPEWDVLLFLAAMAGLDLAQFHLKRKTDVDYMAAKQPQVTAETANVDAVNATVNAEVVTPTATGPAESEAVG